MSKNKALKALMTESKNGLSISEEEEREKGIQESMGQNVTIYKQLKGNRTTVKIPLEDLYDAPPEWNIYKQPSEAEMEEFMYTIENSGLLEPIIVWHKPCSLGKYMILAGHTRKKAFERLRKKTHDSKYDSIECLVKGNTEITADEAVRIIVITNYNKRTLSTYDRIRSVVLLYNRFRYKKGGGQQYVAEQLNVSKKTVENYLKLECLLPQFVDMLEDKYLNINGAVNIARLDEDLQMYILRKYGEKFKSSIVGPEYRKRLSNLKSYLSTTQEIDRALQPDTNLKIKMMSVKIQVPENLEEAFRQMCLEWLESKK